MRKCFRLTGNRLLNYESKSDIQFRVANPIILNVARVVTTSTWVNMTKDPQVFGPLLKDVVYLLKLSHTSVHTFFSKLQVMCLRGKS